MPEPTTIADAITAAQGRVADAYTAISSKGGTLPATQNLANMPTAIGSIPSGSGTKYGASIDCILGDLDANGVLQYPTGSGNLVFSGLKSIQNYGMAYKFYKNQNITSVDLSDLTTTTANCFSNAFYQCSSITSIDLSGLTDVSASNAFSYAFYEIQYHGALPLDLSNLTTVSGNSAFYNAFYNSHYNNSSYSGTLDLSSLTTVSGAQAFAYAFSLCGYLNIDLSSLVTVSGNNAFSGAFSYSSVAGVGGLQTVDLSSLKTISGNSAFSSAFSSCMYFQSASFTSLDDISGSSVFGNCFITCRAITDIYFPALKTTSFGSYINQFSGMFNSNTASSSGTCTVHFPSNLQTTISGLTGYPTFGGNSSRIVLSFDLPQTE